MKAAAILATAAVFSMLAACAGHEAAGSNAAPTAEQRRKARAAVAICREAYGSQALILWTAEGHLVCRRGSLT